MTDVMPATSDSPPPASPVSGADRPVPGWVPAIVATTSLGSAVIHAAAAPVHFDHGTRYGVAFVVMSVLLVVAAVGAWRRPFRGGLLVALAVHATIIGLWAWTRTIGLPGEGVEEIGLTDAVATLLEAAALGAALVGLSLADWVAPAPRSASSRRALPGVLALVATVALAVPAVATADEHDHGQHDHGDAGHVDQAGHEDHPPGGSAANQNAGTPSDVADPNRSISAAFAGIAHGEHSGGTGNAHFHDRTDERCEPTAADADRADELVTRTTLSLDRWRDPQTAADAGYRPLGFEPNGIHHYLNAAFRSDGVQLDPDKPEALLYGRQLDGSLRPVGVMFMAETEGRAGARVGGCLTPWHSHGAPFAPPGRESVEMMHVWTIPVPGGPFAEHIEGEYARLYLGKDAIDPDDALGNARADDDTPRMGIVDLLNSLNVYRPILCSAGIRPALESNIGTPGLADRICDPVLNGPLPGAVAPPITELVGAFGSGAEEAASG